jgi:DNA/RNA endonuclease YhcR with UshA esterase domain
MLALVFAVLASVAPVENPPVITPDEAAKHVGKVVIVRGEISQIVLSVNLTTHINFGGVYPNHVFTATIFKAKQTLFTGVRDYEGKVVQVQGLVHLYRGKPEIVLTERAQIRLAD